ASSGFLGGLIKVSLLQAEDGIRAFHVTGVQTCALPIFGHFTAVHLTVASSASWISLKSRSTSPRRGWSLGTCIRASAASLKRPQIGRASCRGRGQDPGAAARVNSGAYSGLVRRRADQRP